MKRFFLFFFISNFSHAVKPSYDGYIFESKEYEKISLEIEVVVLHDKFEFAREKNMNHLRLQNVEAFSIIVPGSNTCKIYVKDPEWKYQPEYIGHELAHCIWGRWHK